MQKKKDKSYKNGYESALTIGLGGEGEYTSENVSASGAIESNTVSITDL